MAGAFTTVDLSQLPAPDVVEALDYEAILSEMLSDLQSRDPAFSALVESDPAFKILEVAAYREVLIRQRVNDAAKAVMLAFAMDEDLDQIGANFDVERLELEPANDDVIPPTPAVMEEDEDYRARIQLSLEGITTAGSEGSYVFHGLGADADVRDIEAVSPNPGEVVVYVLSRTGDGTASAELIDIVEAALNAEDVRPLTDQVTVESATIVEFEINAELVLYPGPDSEVVRQAAEDALAVYVESIRRIGYDVSLSGVMQALNQPGVQRVKLHDPTPEPDSESRLVAVDSGESAYCTSIAVAVASATDV